MACRFFLSNEHAAYFLFLDGMLIFLWNEDAEFFLILVCKDAVIKSENTY